MLAVNLNMRQLLKITLRQFRMLQMFYREVNLPIMSPIIKEKELDKSEAGDINSAGGVMNQTISLSLFP